MSAEAPVTYMIAPANKFLWAVKSYLFLLERKDPLPYGEGMKKLYSMSSGIATLLDGDIDLITVKSERMGLIPKNLDAFMMKSIIKNCKFYAERLAEMIENRVVAIAEGRVKNPEPRLKYSPVAARRSFYLPPTNLLKRIDQAIAADVPQGRWDNAAPVPSLNEVSQDAIVILSRMQVNQGHIFPNQSSFGATTKIARDLVEAISRELSPYNERYDYSLRARSALTILWMIGKLLYGDLTIHPERYEINDIDIGKKLSITDGTLAAIPFPIQQTIEFFNENGPGGLSLKAHKYLSAVSAASFSDPNPTSDEG